MHEEAAQIRNLMDRANKMLYRFINEIANKEGLNAFQTLLLEQIYHHPGITFRKLCKQVDMPYTVVNGLLNGFIKKGYVKRISSDKTNSGELYLGEQMKSFIESEFTNELLNQISVLLDPCTKQKRTRIVGALEDLVRLLEPQASNKR